jgi:5-methyltetrahydropteroyltriglutamate--homocysteine methyltransferase
MQSAFPLISLTDEFSTQVSISGIHPRSENTVKVSRDFDRLRATEEELDRAFNEDANNLVSLELECGFDSLSDGQLRWQDFIRPFSESVGGLKGGADLSRWFDTNTFYRKPSVEEKISSAPVHLERYSANVPTRDNKSRKISLPGPYTLASLVENHSDVSKTELVYEFARVLRSTINDLVKIGYSTIQVNEPSLVYRYGESAVSNSNDLDAFVYAFSEAISGIKADLWLHTYFGDCAKILKDLLALDNISTIGVDFTQTSLNDISSLNFEGKSLACGCVDGRNSLLESPEWIASFCKQAIGKLKPSGIVIIPSCDLKFLPRISADNKVKSMAQAKKTVQDSTLQN